jgi:hypothetical protein
LLLYAILNIQKGSIVTDYKVGDRVFLLIQFNSPGQLAPGDKVIGAVIKVCPTVDHNIYQVELDMVWRDRVNTQGQKIVMGNIMGDRRMSHV